MKQTTQERSMKENDSIALRGYLERIGAELANFRTAVVREKRGNYTEELARIKLTDSDIKAPQGYEPTATESKAILEHFKDHPLPTYKPARSLLRLPALAQDGYVFQGTDGRILMVQSRIEEEEGKRYIPWTFWSDGKWYAMEPDELLPLWGLEQLKDHAIVFLHEGCKAAAAARKIAEAPDGHPWGAQLAHAAHLGWIGGARQPHRVDWDVLNKAGVERAYIVSDNDQEGRSAVPRIAKALNCTCWTIQFSGEFPVGFDLADPFPDAMFEQGHYKGPTFRTCQCPATWMTDVLEPKGKGRPPIVLRPHAQDMWLYVPEGEQFVCSDMPDIRYSKRQLNDKLAPYSDTDNLVRLILKSQRLQPERLAYRPDMMHGIIGDQGNLAVNTYVQSEYRPCKGDAGLWQQFMERLIPNEGERREVMRWVATFLARPEVRIGYALLMISETHGVGKTTLGNHILAPLAGKRNVSFPGEQDILSPFNAWIAHKRLAVINEIYTGNSWKSYNLLKSCITDNKVAVNQKFVAQYTVENWIQLYACSNSTKALRMAESDRRWYCPQLNEEPEPKGSPYWAELYQWLRTGGLEVILYWADNWGDYILAGEHAPMSELKRQMIEDSKSEAVVEAERIGTLVADMEEPIVLAVGDVHRFLKSGSQGKVYDQPHEIRKALEAGGLTDVLPAHIPASKRRIKVDARREHCLGNAAALRSAPEEEEERRAWVRGRIAQPGKVVEGDI